MSGTGPHFSFLPDPSTLHLWTHDIIPHFPPHPHYFRRYVNVCVRFNRDTLACTILFATLPIPTLSLLFFLRSFFLPSWVPIAC
jgi:hypothetical protein